MPMKAWIVCLGVAGAVLTTSGKCRAGESALLKAIEDGNLAFETEIAVPVQGSAAPLPPGWEDLSAHPLYAINQSEERNITDKAFPLMSSKWPYNAAFVCWENPGANDQVERLWVQEAVQESWERHSALRFLGWQNCNSDTQGIRILIEDIGPHVKMLGKFLNGRRNGMVLNFTFERWGISCRAMREYCIRVIAVHEFGHAIGFAHEQNRPDTEGDCALERQGPDGDLLLTPWDPDSVMNYCNEDYNNDGILSEFDMKAVQYIYGPPGN